MGHYSGTDHFKRIYLIIYSDSYMYISFPVVGNSHRVFLIACHKTSSIQWLLVSGIVDGVKSVVT